MIPTHGRAKITTSQATREAGSLLGRNSILITVST